MVHGLVMGGVQPVIKHMLGQGRANSDSHIKLPIVETSLDVLENNDFLVFKNVRNVEWAMTAHIKYQSIDPINPVTYSSQSIKYIKNKIGFQGIIISDCLTMKSLSEPYADKASKAIYAGHDVVFFGGADSVIIKSIVRDLPSLSEKALKRILLTFKSENNINEARYFDALLEYKEVLSSLGRKFKKLSEKTFNKNLDLITSVLKKENSNFSKNLSPLYEA